jgi:type IV pilus assembly protein PilY1
VTSLNATEQAFFGPLNVSLLSQFPSMTDGTGATALQQQAAQMPGKLVNFLRGQRANEDFETNSVDKLFRKRDAVLGDMVGSQPVYVKEPFASYQDNGYSGFKSSNAGRSAMLYVGANDGMLHAFYATTSLLDPLHGQEAWAVIPSAVLPNMYKLADENYKRDGHQFFVDGTPVVGDVCISSPCAGTADWRTILVGGLNAGGRGYYALDVTVPGAPPVPLWEFKQDTSSCPAPAPALMPANIKGDCNLGLTFGKPVITKLAGVWVVMFTSGYNNVSPGDGGGYLYVVNAMTGNLIHKIATGAGNAGTPSGLGQINNYVDNVVIDNTTLRVYGGDVLGNMWRFDFLPTPTATLLGSAKDLSNNLQPITVRPELAELDGKPFVMFGTGRLLGGTDVTDSQRQSVYGFTDPLTGASPIYTNPIRDVLRPMRINQTGLLAAATRTIVCTGSAGDCARPTGWVLDLPEAGERVNVEMKLVLGALVFSSNVPEEVPCSVGGHSWFNVVDFSTGAAIPGGTSSGFLSSSLNVGFNIVQLPLQPGRTNPSYMGIFRQSNATNEYRQPPIPEPKPVGKRISWREIAQ